MKRFHLFMPWNFKNGGSIRMNWLHDSWFEIEQALKRYVHYIFMGGDDNGDKDNEIGVSFTKKSFFKKWYHMCLFGIFDFIVINGWWLGCVEYASWESSESIIPYEQLELLLDSCRTKDLQQGRKKVGFCFTVKR